MIQQFRASVRLVKIEQIEKEIGRAISKYIKGQFRLLKHFIGFLCHFIN
mgnify:CR=1 FL=1